MKQYLNEDGKPMSGVGRSQSCLAKERLRRAKEIELIERKYKMAWKSYSNGPQRIPKRMASQVPSESPKQEERHRGIKTLLPQEKDGPRVEEEKVIKGEEMARTEFTEMASYLEDLT